MKLHSFQHVPFEGPGIIADWAAAQGVQVTATRWYEDARPPDIDAIDWLVVMGGPMGAYDEERYAWLREEKRCIEQAIKQGNVVIGVCLGAQLIADVLGARVYPHTQKEIGWFPIELTEAGQQSPLFGFLPPQLKVFHWHGDTFDLPHGAVHIARSAVCENQVFVYEERVIGLQFHMEMTRTGVEAIVQHCADELVDAPTIQQPGEMLAHSEHITVLNGLMQELLGRVHAHANPDSV
jgi:GMP synthase (glutamine-hydrolysing)